MKRLGVFLLFPEWDGGPDRQTDRHTHRQTCLLESYTINSILTTISKQGFQSNILRGEGGGFQHWSNPSIKFAGTDLYKRVERGISKVRVLSKNTKQWPWPGLEPRPLDPEFSALTMRPSGPPRLLDKDKVFHKLRTPITSFMQYI